MLNRIAQQLLRWSDKVHFHTGIKTETSIGHIEKNCLAFLKRIFDNDSTVDSRYLEIEGTL